VAGIVAVGRAAELAIERLSEVQTRVRGLRDRLEETLLAAVPDSHRNGAREPRLPNTSNLAFDGLEAEALLMMLDQAGMCASSGSACTTGSPEPSRVLMSMGLGRERARGSVRFSLGYYNTDEDVDCLVGQLPRMAARLRGMV
jgi:cysteine desulfurase